MHAAEVVENLEAIGGVMGHGLVMDTAWVLLNLVQKDVIEISKGMDGAL